MPDPHMPRFAVPPLDPWCAERLPLCLAGMRKAVSPVGLVKRRPAFGQTIVPARGSVVAAADPSPDASPDYFFHWLRDSALVMDALMRLSADDAGDAADYADFVRFSNGLDALDGARHTRHKGFGTTADPALAVYVRSVLDLEALHGDGLRGEVRFNPDGTLDTLDWARPQFDGAALRALTLLRRPLQPGASPALIAIRDGLLRADLDFVADHVGDLCYDVWEERFGHHYHTRLVVYAALALGGPWAQIAKDHGRAARFEAAALSVRVDLDRHWSAERGAYIATLDADDDLGEAHVLDSSVLLGVLHARLPDGPHSPLDPKVQATLAVFETMFADLPVNQRLAPDWGPLMGRFRGDDYFGGGGFVMLTAAAAEICYLIGSALRNGRSLPVTEENTAWLGRVLGGAPPAPGSTLPASRDDVPALVLAFRDAGDRYLGAIAALAPEDGSMPEQFDKVTGDPTSAPDLAWSHGCVATAILTRAELG